MSTINSYSPNRMSVSSVDLNDPTQLLLPNNRLISPEPNTSCLSGISLRNWFENTRVYCSNLPPIKSLPGTAIHKFNEIVLSKLCPSAPPATKTVNTGNKMKETLGYLKVTLNAIEYERMGDERSQEEWDELEKFVKSLSRNVGVYIGQPEFEAFVIQKPDNNFDTITSRKEFEEKLPGYMDEIYSYIPKHIIEDSVNLWKNFEIQTENAKLGINNNNSHQVIIP